MSENQNNKKASTDDLKNKLAKRIEMQGSASVPQDPASTINGYLKKMMPEISRALPKHLDGNRLTRIALTTIRTNPKLLECNVPSLLAAVMMSAQLGLEPGLLGHCYFVPFYNSRTKSSDVQFIIGYKGLIDLVRRSGEVTSIVANEVYDKDHFEFEYGLDEKLVHKPYLSGDRGALKCFYAYARYKDGGHAFMVMSKDEIDRIRDKYSKAKNFGPWVDEYANMAKKTVIRQLIKYMPISVEVMRNVSVDETTRSDFHEDPRHVDSDYIDISIPQTESEIVEDQEEKTEEGAE